VVVDWRDQEIDPHRGVFVEGLSERAGYTRTTAAARVYLHPFEKLMIAARIGRERMTGSPPVAAQLNGVERGPFVALGGYRSLRGYYDARSWVRGSSSAASRRATRCCGRHGSSS